MYLAEIGPAKLCARNRNSVRSAERNLAPHLNKAARPTAGDQHLQHVRLAHALLYGVTIRKARP